MYRGFRALFVVSIVVVSVGLAAVLIWQQTVHGALPVLGWFLLGLGAAAAVLHLTASDDFLRRHFGEPGSGMREFCRRGWVGVLFGATMLGVHYLDRWVQATAAEAQFRLAFNRGVSAARARDWQSAADAFSAAIRLDPNSATAYRNRGIAYGHQGLPDRALADLDEAVRLNPNDAEARYDRGVTYVQKGDDDRALAEFSAAISIKPDYARAYRARGHVYAKKGDDARAKADQQKATALDPSGEKSGGENQ